MRWGVSALPGDCGAWARLLGSYSPAIDRAMRAAWDAVRRLLIGVPAPRLRKSTTFLPTRSPTMRGIDNGNTAWLMASTAMVLLMTPGLAFFYGGMVRARHVLTMLRMIFACLGIVTVIWFLVRLLAGLQW